MLLLFFLYEHFWCSPQQADKHYATRTFPQSWQSPPDSQQLEICSLSAISLAMHSPTNRVLNVPAWGYPTFLDVFYWNQTVSHLNKLFGKSSDILIS